MVHVCVSKYTHMRVRAHTHARACAHTHTHTHTCTHAPDQYYRITGNKRLHVQVVSQLVSNIDLYKY